jgi:electron transfer flavoprotein beta subunit
MHIVVLMKHVPDLVEELEIDEDTGRLDQTFLRLVPNEMDEHALEQAVLLKEQHGGSITVLTFESDEADETLYTAAAKGADRVLKISGDGAAENLSNRAAAMLIDRVLEDVPFDLFLTGTQAVDDLDASVGALLSARRDLPYVGYVTSVVPEGPRVRLRKEYPGGLIADMLMDLPGVIGIQAAEKPPRYVVTSLVMDAMRSTSLEEIAPEPPELSPLPSNVRLRVPGPTGRAEVLEGDVEQIAERLIALMRDRGIVAEGESP